MATSPSWEVLPSTEQQRVSAASVMFPCTWGCQRQLCQGQIQGDKTGVFDIQFRDYKQQVDKTKAQSTYEGWWRNTDASPVI